jgi:hypothetical protein
VSAARESITPYVVTSQGSAVVWEQLKKHGVRFGVDLVMKVQPKPYVNAEIFIDYLKTVFLPNLAELRKVEAFAEEDAVLLMDNCPSHVTREVIGILTETRGRVITFAPNTTQIFQILDLTLFGVLKHQPRYDLPFDDDAATVTFIMKVYRDFKKTILEANIRAAFQAIALEYNRVAAPYRLLFNEEKLRESKGFQELWRIDFLWINCRLCGVPLTLAELSTQGKTTVLNNTYLLLIRA